MRLCVHVVHDRFCTTTTTAKKRRTLNYNEQRERDTDTYILSATKANTVVNIISRYMHQITNLWQYVCVIYASLDCLSPFSCKRKSSVSDSNHLHFYPSWKWNKKELKKRDGVKKTWGEKIPIFIHLIIHSFIHIFSEKYILF